MVARREGWREGIVRELEIDMYTVIFDMDKQQSPTI